MLMIDIVEIPVDESMSGTLWLFPCAVSPPMIDRVREELIARAAS